uniref:Uncharacterized protein n=1 Tax=Lotharella oceanica TaxID=641309 RepID=A0A7S2X7N7_9EUKA
MELWSPRSDTDNILRKDIGTWSPSSPRAGSSRPDGILRGSKRGSLFFDVECDIFGLGCDPLKSSSPRLVDTMRTEQSSTRLEGIQESSIPTTPTSHFEPLVLPAQATSTIVHDGQGDTEIRNGATYYKGLRYVGPTRDTRPAYKSNQKWKWDIYPHGISQQGNKLRVQIKQKGLNPTYPYFLATQQGVLDAAMFRDTEVRRLWENGTLVRMPKFNFEHPKPSQGRSRKRRHESQISDSPSTPKLLEATLSNVAFLDDGANGESSTEHGHKKRRFSRSQGERMSVSWPVENAASDNDCIMYKNLKYIGPTSATRPAYKSNQRWEWEIYPHGISKQGKKLRVQIKQKGLNPVYPYYQNTKDGVFEAALFRDQEVRRLWKEGILVRAPKFNFEDPSSKVPTSTPRADRSKKSALGVSAELIDASDTSNKLPDPVQVPLDLTKQEDALGLGAADLFGEPNIWDQFSGELLA